MKQALLRTGAMLGLVAMLAVASVQAQSTGGLTVNVPFDFTAGKTKLSAGVYTIRRSSGSILALRSANNGKDILVFAPYTVQRAGENLPGQLVFNRYGDDYFLSAMWTNRDQIGSGTNQTRSERSRAGELAKAKSRPELVAVVALAN